MKTFCFVLLLCSLNSYGQHGLPEWIKIFSENGKTIFIRNKPFENDGDLFKAWIKTIYRRYLFDEVNYENVFTIALYAFDCKKSKLGLMKSTLYDSDDKEIEGCGFEVDTPEMKYLNPGSAGEEFVEQLCKYKDIVK